MNMAKELHPSLPKYPVIEELYVGTRTLVYRAGGDANDEKSPSVVIKILRQEYPTFNDLLQFRNQYTITKNLDIPGIIHPYSLEPCRNGYALVMEDFGGISLREYTKTNPLSLLEVLKIAQQLSTILHELHQNRVIHKDIKPANILIHPETKQVKLIDFSIASLLPKETQEIQNPNVLEGTLAYLAPEQTGRMNRGIDYRADFYSLGVTLYELLTGDLPFLADEPLELVHCHIAKTPISPHQINQNIPPILSEIVLKLMAKNAEDRYQSALGLKHDLHQCLRQWEETETIIEFELGQQDRSDRFLIPEKLYGRQPEVNLLLEAFDRVTNSTSEILLVAGFSGIGKTAVVNEVHKPITRHKGYFIKGKFDQFNRNIPFFAFVRAMRDFMGQLLSEFDANLTEWRTNILQAVGENGQVLIEVIPELESVIGKQPLAPELSGTAAQNRFNLLFQKFIEVFTTPEHPLVIFLDDLQWADSASLQLIKILMEDKSYLLLLGAYRDNEVSPAHPFILAVEELKKAGKTVNTITLAPLDFRETNQLIADTLRCANELARPLTELIDRKTKGNPFFTTQFLKALHEDGYITFNPHRGYWESDLAQINARSLTDDVVEFMAQQLQKLPAETQEILQLAACIGNQFDLDTLAIVSEQSAAEASTALWKALQEGLIIPQSEIYKFYLSTDQADANTNKMEIAYRFLHDRVQQAAYSLIPEDQKQQTHYQIGQLLLQQISPSAREDRIFELVNQLNYGTALITDQKERDELALLNLISCRKARSATAYEAGREYARIGLYLLGENAWYRQYKMSLEFHELAAEFASLCGDFGAMQQFFNTVIKRTQLLLEQVNVYCIIIQAHISQNKLTEAIAIALKFLQKLNVTFPEIPTEKDIEQAIAEIEKMIGPREIEDFVHLPEMTNGEKIAIVLIVNSIMPAASISGSPLFPLLVALSVKLSIEYGNIPASSYAYACYGLISCNLNLDVNTGVKFGQLALRVADQLDAKIVKPKVLFIVALFIFHRQSHLKEILPLFQESYTSSLETGNQAFAGYSAHGFCCYSLWCSQPLATLERETHAYCNGLVQLNQLTTANWCRIYWQVMLNLLGLAEHPSVLSGTALQETETLPRMLEAHDFFGLYSFHLYKLMLCYLFGEIESAKSHAVEARRYFIAAAGTVSESAFYFYDSLTDLADLNPRSSEISEVFGLVEQNQTQLQEQWAKYAPMNHQHKVDLVEAERCRVLGQNYEAGDYYDRAISGAKANEYIQEEALGNELAAKFYLNWGKEKIAAGYMQEAYYCYARWGAKAKVDDLEKRYPQLLAPIVEQPRAAGSWKETIAIGTISPTHTSTSISESLDLATLLKASQAISGEIELNKLITTLLEIALTNAGATKCVLFLKKDIELKIVALIEQGKSPQILPSIPLELSQDVPISLVNTVKRTGQNLVLIWDGRLETQFAADSYIQKHQPKSVICSPILHQGQLIGILYLENNLTVGAFSRDRMEVINLICAQAAISLENARLYQESQTSAQHLTQKSQELEGALQSLKETQLQMIQNEKMSALGNLVAGVAHEINNPVGFLNGNIQPALDYIKDLLGLIDLIQEKYPQLEPEVAEEIETIELDYIRQDLPKLVGSMREGVKRIQDISNSLRTFSRADSDRPVPCNIHDGIDSTIMILKHRLKANETRPEIKVIKAYSNLPQIKCYAGQLNQVFMNLLANAIDAVEESNHGRKYGEIANKITVKTEFSDNQKQVIIRIQDNGIGMTEAVQKKIFDDLFTTKEVGKGTGLGLAIARQIVVEKHGGILEVKSELGQGSEFCIRLLV